MDPPTPIQSLLGGLSIPLPAHALLLLNGNVFGISGFVHHGVRGNLEGLAGAVGLLLGGAFVSRFDGNGPMAPPSSIAQVLLSGFLVGLGTKLASGCTSGHMICGVSRFSLRSIAATATFFVTGVITTQIFHGNLPATPPPDWSVSDESLKLFALQAVPLTVSVLLYALAPKLKKQVITLQTEDEATEPSSPPRHALRILTYLITGFQFALALRLSGLCEATRVLSFLLLPFHRAFDPSLVFVAAGALSLAIPLYRYTRGDETPRLGGNWSILGGGEIDSKLLMGSAIFGIGWGIGGICPGPGIVNFGRSLGAGGLQLTPYAGWLGSMIVGGLMA